MNQYQYNTQLVQPNGKGNQFQNYLSPNNKLMKQGYTYQENYYNNNIPKINHNYAKNTYSNSNHINSHKYHKEKNRMDNFNQLLPKNLEMPEKSGSIKGLNGFHNKKIDNNTNNNNNYQHSTTYQIHSFEGKSTQKYNNSTTNIQMPKNFYSEFIKNPEGISPISNVLEPSRAPYAMNNRFYPKRFDNNSRGNEIKKEISSDALDNLFDFNIGKELEPEPEFIIEK